MRRCPTRTFSRQIGHGPSATSRTNYSVHVSRDNGITWEPHAQVYAGASAYSDMTLVATGKVACLFEKDAGYQEITLGVVAAAAPATSLH